VQPDLYELLGVSPEAPPERIDVAIEIAAADARVLQYASDPQMAAEARHTLVSLDHARQVLLDPYARRSYDLWRSGLEPHMPTAAPVMFRATATPSRTWAPPIAGPSRSRVVAALLAFFLGWLGVHNFYLGRNSIGLAQLLTTVFTCGAAAPAVCIWAFVEGVMVLAGSLRDGDGRRVM
jgi:TM2 domain-containing membrane protein YozV